MNEHKPLSLIKTLRPIIFFNSYVLLIIGIAALVPLAFSFFENDYIDEKLFLIMSSSCLVLGFVGIKFNKSTLDKITTLQIYLITTSCWLLLGLLGAIPLLWGFHPLSIADALFESFSGITTTGSTVMSGIENLPSGLLIWRGLIQWIGGVGIIVLSISILPYLRVGGMRLFSTESSEWAKKTHPRSHNMMASILKVYVLLTIACGITYYFGGMSVFDAVVHAMTTLSTGGYSNYDASFGYFTDKPILIWASSFFMILGALPFVFYVNMVLDHKKSKVFDSQIKGFLGFLLVVITILSLERIISSDLSVFEIVTQVAFNIISVVTTTGYASTDYTVWSEFSAMLFFFLMFIGGCSGSTSGSIKIFRFQIAYRMLSNQLKQMTYPNGIFPLKYNGQIVSNEIIRSLVAFTLFFVLSVVMIAISLSLLGLDFMTSLTAASTAVTNVGPGLGDIIGPAGNFSSLPDAAKLILCFGMLLGRLEIMTVLILLTPAIWKK